MKNIFRKLFDIHEGEGQKASLMFIYIFLVIASLLIVKPVRNSLFLTHFGISKLPFAFIAVALFAAVVTTVYSKFVKKFQLNLLIFYSTLISIACLILSRILFFTNYQVGWFFYAFYVWVALFGVISTSQFWLLANYVFNAREAKRLFGFVGAGAISGGIFGGYLTKFFAPVIGTENMIFFCIGFLICCIIIQNQVWKKYARYNYNEKILYEKGAAKSYSKDSTLKLILTNRHLSLLAGIIGVGVIVANLVDYQFSAIAKAVITDEDQLTAFFGFWLSNLSIASLIIQFFFTGRILKLFGVSTSLFFLPAGIFIGALSVLINPALWSAIIIKVSDGSFKQSVNKAGFELLALPIPSNVKNRVKAFIDIFVDSLATGIGGILLIIFTIQLGFSVQAISFIIAILIVVWFYLILHIKREYLNSFRQALEKRSINLEEQTISIKDASVFESLTRVLNGINERQILYVLQLIENVKNVQFVRYFKRFIEDEKVSAEIKVQVLKNANQYYNVNFSDNAKELVKHDNYNLKVEAIRYICHHSSNGKTELLDLLNHSDYKIRSAALLCSAHEIRNNSEFRAKINIKQYIDHFYNLCYQADYKKEEIHFMKINLATVIGVAGSQKLYPYLKDLLNDDCPKVLQSAITSAGTTRDLMFVDILINHLNNNMMRRCAREAIAKYSVDVVDCLSENLENPSKSGKVRLAIPKVLALIGSQKSVSVLIKNLTQNDLKLRFEILKALNKLKTNFLNLKFDKQVIKSCIFDETKYYYKILSLLYQYQRISENENLTILQNNDSNRIIDAQKLLLRALEEKLNATLERIFRLLGLRYLSQDIYNIYLGIISKQSDLKANAVELLDNILDVNLKRLIIPIVEADSHAARAKIIQQFFGFELATENKSLEFLLTGEDNWLKSCVLYYIAEMKNDGFKDSITKFAADSNPVIRETVQYYLEKIS